MGQRRRRSAAETVDFAKVAELPQRRIAPEDKDELLDALDVAYEEISKGITYAKGGKLAVQLLGILIDGAS